MQKPAESRVTPLGAVLFRTSLERGPLQTPCWGGAMIVRTATGTVGVFFLVCVLAGSIQWGTSDRRRLALFAFGALLVAGIAARVAARTPRHAGQRGPQSELSATGPQPPGLVETSTPTAADAVMTDDGGPL